jgi:hypothetical protein
MIEKKHYDADRRYPDSLLRFEGSIDLALSIVALKIIHVCQKHYDLHHLFKQQFRVP